MTSADPAGPSPELLYALKTEWLALIELAVWGDIKSEKLGAVSKLRKRILDLGERLRSVSNDREWIPQPRERLKNLLGSCLNLRDTLLLVERAAQDLSETGDFPLLGARLIVLHRLIQEDLRDAENKWACTLTEINKSALKDDQD